MTLVHTPPAPPPRQRVGFHARLCFYFLSALWACHPPPPPDLRRPVATAAAVAAASAAAVASGGPVNPLSRGAGLPRLRGRPRPSRVG